MLCELLRASRCCATRIHVRGAGIHLTFASLSPVQTGPQNAGLLLRRWSFVSAWKIAI
jgi:hypothetical protein